MSLQLIVVAAAFLAGVGFIIFRAIQGSTLTTVYKTKRGARFVLVNCPKHYKKLQWKKEIGPAAEQVLEESHDFFVDMFPDREKNIDKLHAHLTIEVVHEPIVYGYDRDEDGKTVPKLAAGTWNGTNVTALFFDKDHQSGDLPISDRWKNINFEEAKRRFVSVNGHEAGHAGIDHCLKWEDLQEAVEWAKKQGLKSGDNPDHYWFQMVKYPWS